MHYAYKIFIKYEIIGHSNKILFFRTFLIYMEKIDDFFYNILYIYYIQYCILYIYEICIYRIIAACLSASRENIKGHLIASTQIYTFLEKTIRPENSQYLELKFTKFNQNLNMLVILKTSF